MVTIRFRGGQSWSVLVRDHELICDQPASKGGQDLGPAPPEWFGASLGACIGHYVHAYLEARSLPSEGLDIDVHWEIEKAPKRISKFEIKVTLPPGIPEANRPRLQRAAESCLIHATLHHPPVVDITLIRAEDVGAAQDHSAA